VLLVASLSAIQSLWYIELHNAILTARHVLERSISHGHVSVCLSVRPSVTRHYCIETAERIEFAFGIEATFDLSYVERYSCIFKNKNTPVWNFVPNSRLRNFATARRPSVCCQLTWTLSVINWRLSSIRWEWGSSSRGSVCRSRD